MKREEILKRQNLAGLNLSGASLGGCDLSGRNLRGSDLSFSHLGCAILKGADLRNANLRGANLGAADLTGADLRYADLRGTNLTGTNMLGTDLRESMRDEGQKKSQIINRVPLEETEAFVQAQEEGFHPLSHWGHVYDLKSGETLYKSRAYWPKLKRNLGGIVFGDRSTFNEVRLVQQYKHYSQWAYMITKHGFERIVNTLGVSVEPKK